MSIQELFKRASRSKSHDIENLNRVEYLVKTDADRDLSLSFHRRQDAREYKRLLAMSKHQISSVIVRLEWHDGYIATERKTS